MLGIISRLLVVRVQRALLVSTVMVDQRTRQLPWLRLATARQERIVRVARPAVHVLLRLVDILQPSVQLILIVTPAPAVALTVRRDIPTATKVMGLASHRATAILNPVRGPGRRLRALRRPTVLA